MINVPFGTNDMNSKLTENWNAVVKKTDLVFHLGDFAFSRHNSFFSQLNGIKYLVRGNHDSKECEKLEWQNIYDICEFEYEDTYMVLCHYPLTTWNHVRHGAFHFYGHIHSNIDQFPLQKMMDVGVRNIGYKPIKLDTAVSLTRKYKREFNRN